MLRFRPGTGPDSGTLVSTSWHAGQPLNNNDTYFHLRFGHEFLSGDWSLRDPGSVSSFATADWVPTQWLPQVVMAQTEDWFGLAGVAWLSGLLFLSLALVALWAVPDARPSRPSRRCSSSSRSWRLHLGHLDAAPAGQLRPRRGHHRGLAAHAARRQAAVAAGAAHLGLDDVPRDVAGRDRDRRGRRRSGSPSTAAPAPQLLRMAAVPVLSAAVVAAHPGRPRSVRRRARASARAASTSTSGTRPTSPALRRPAPAARARCVVPAAARASGSRGSTSCCSGSRRSGRSTRCAPCRWRPAARAARRRGAAGALRGGRSVARLERRGCCSSAAVPAWWLARGRGAADRRRAARHARPGSTARSATCPRAPGSSTTAASAAT